MIGGLFLAVTVSVVVYVLAVALIPRQALMQSSKYTRHMVNRLQQQSLKGGNDPLLKNRVGLLEDPNDGPLVRAYLLIPGAQSTVPLIQRSGLWHKLDQIVLAFLLIFLFMLFVTVRIGILSLPLSLIGTLILAYMFLKNREGVRTRKFVEQFPDALDMIVRSIRSGYHLNAALSMVADNTPAPLGFEFRRIVDETNYGWNLIEAVMRMGTRVNEPDVKFFTVVLAVQQETGGNLSEVLNNLAAIIRKRKHLRMKIRALSSEGRATAWILGLLPVLMISAVFYTSPQHLDPLFTTSSGNIVLACVIGAMFSGMMMVRKIIKMDI